MSPAALPPLSPMFSVPGFDFGAAATAPTANRTRPLAEVIATAVRPGDVVHYPWISTRAGASAFEIVRQARAGRLRDLTVISASLRADVGLLVASGGIRRIVTSFSATTYPSIRPNALLLDALAEGSVELEEWSLLALVQRTLAAALGWPFVPADTVRDSDLPNAAEPGLGAVADPFRDGARTPVMPPLACDVTLIHCPIADWEGNGVLFPPFAEDVYSAYAARRGVILTAERIVSPQQLRRFAHHVRVPAARVIGLAEVPLGAHPSALPVPVDVGVAGYGEDYDFLTAMGRLGRVAEAEEFCRTWIDSADRHEYLARLGANRIEHLFAMELGESWQTDMLAKPDAVDGPDEAAVGERLAVSAARAVATQCRAHQVRTVLAGAGVSSLAAALARVELLEEAGHVVDLVFESGVIGYVPRPYDSTLSNARNVPTARQLTNSLETLGMLLGGPAEDKLAVLAAGVIDQHGNADSNRSWTGGFLVGGGGSTDIARATSTVAVIPADPRRLVDTAGFVTYGGRRVDVIATEFGHLTRVRDGYVLSAWFADQAGCADAALEQLRARSGWDVTLGSAPVRLDPPRPAELAFLRTLDPQRNLLG